MSLRVVFQLLFFDVDELHLHSSPASEALGFNGISRDYRCWRHSVTWDEEFLSPLVCPVEVDISFLLPKQPSVIFLEFVDVHDIRKLLEDGKARRKTSTRIFRCNLEEFIEGDRLVLVSDLLSVHTPVHLVVLLEHMVAELIEG